MCQVSIVVSQGLNTFNNLISTSAPFVCVGQEWESRRFVSPRGRSAPARFSLVFLPLVIEGIALGSATKHFREVDKYELK